MHRTLRLGFGYLDQAIQDAADGTVMIGLFILFWVALAPIFGRLGMVGGVLLYLACVVLVSLVPFLASRHLRDLLFRGQSETTEQRDSDPATDDHGVGTRKTFQRVRDGLILFSAFALVFVVGRTEAALLCLFVFYTAIIALMPVQRRIASRLRRRGSH